MDQVADLVDRPGLEVGILLRNRPASVGLLLGVLRAGGCVVTINPGRGADRARDDIAALDLPVLAGDPDDLADLVPDGSRATTAAATDVGTPLEVTPGRGDAGGPTPGAAVRMLTSGTTGPPKRVDLTYETLERVLVGAKHYESQPRRHAAAARAVWPWSTRRWCTSAGCSGCCSASATAARSRSSTGSRSTAGSTPSAATDRRRPAWCRPRCAWCSRPTSTPPT